MVVTIEDYIKKLPKNYASVFSEGLAHNYNIEVCSKKYSFPSIMVISDSTLRDGEQQPGIYFTPEQKLEIARKLSEAGVFVAEACFPAVSEEEVRAGKMIMAEKLNTVFSMMARARKEDIDAALRADAQQLALFTSASELHIRYKLKMTPEENIRMYLEAVDYARDHGLRFAFGHEDDSRAHIPYIVEMVKAVKKAGGRYFMGTNLTDTSGSLTPCATRWLVKQYKKELPNVGLILHFHNDLGLATANTIVGLEAGAGIASTTVMGIGERAGNAPLEEVVMALKTLYGIDVRIKTEKLPELAQLVSKYAGVPTPINKPIIGANAFKHESGIHAAGVIAHPSTYEPIPSEWLNRQSTFKYGKFSGTKVVLKGPWNHTD